MLQSNNSGQVDSQRTFVVTGRERHVENARDDFLPYPQRALRTKEFLYIINFKPDRWPMGNPYRLDSENVPDAQALAADTRVTFLDMDASPTKAWLVTHRNDPQWKSHYDLAFAKRPREELYILADDPQQIHNVAADPQFDSIRAELNRQLMDELTRTNDPRVAGDGMYFEQLPLAGPLAQPRPPKKGQ